jgi:hypothetical protein
MIDRLYFRAHPVTLMEFGRLTISKGSWLKSLIALLALSLCAAASVAAPEPEDPASAEILDRYLSHTQAQQSSLRNLQMDVEIDASLPKLQKTGKLQALRSISKLGLITYQGLKFIGDNTIKNDVIVRYLTAEKQSQDLSQMSLSPKNYKFKYKGQFTDHARLVHVFQVSPRKKMVGLYKGELWVDAATYLPLRESGRFVKNPSVFLKKIEFVRDYEIKDGVAFPSHIESRVDTRFWGPAEMDINFKNISRPVDELSAVPVSQVSQ